MIERYYSVLTFTKLHNHFELTEQLVLLLILTGNPNRKSCLRPWTYTNIRTPTWYYCCCHFSILLNAMFSNLVYGLGMWPYGWHIHQIAWDQSTASISPGKFEAPSNIVCQLFMIFQWVFLPDHSSRQMLTLPPLGHVDYRAACFCHRKLVEIGYVCSVCLSIFCQFNPICSTCKSVGSMCVRVTVCCSLLGIEIIYSTRFPVPGLAGSKAKRKKTTQ